MGPLQVDLSQPEPVVPEVIPPEPVFTPRPIPREKAAVPVETSAPQNDTFSQSAPPVGSSAAAGPSQTTSAMDDFFDKYVANAVDDNPLEGRSDPVAAVEKVAPVSPVQGSHSGMILDEASIEARTLDPAQEEDPNQRSVLDLTDIDETLGVLSENNGEGKSEGELGSLNSQDTQTINLGTEGVTMMAPRSLAERLSTNTIRFELSEAAKNALAKQGHPVLEVSVEFTVTPAGPIKGLKIKSTSGITIVDTELKRVLEEVVNFLPSPGANEETTQITIEIRMNN